MRTINDQDQSRKLIDRRKLRLQRGWEKMEINTREKTDIIIFDIEGEIRRSDIT